MAAIQQLSLARNLDDVIAVASKAARELTGADGASFVLRDGDKCYYVNEDAIGPLWKGQRFPMTACISGWSMLNRQPAVIEDIYADPRVPADAYRPTFVKSLVMVPIRTEAPIGAIGNYWAQTYRATPEQVELLKALANTTSVAIENVQVYSELEERVRSRTHRLDAANRELESFSYSVSHDLQAPLRRIQGFTELLAQERGDLRGERPAHCLQRILSETERMTELINNLLRLSRLTRVELKLRRVDLSQIAREVLTELQASTPGRRAEVRIQEKLTATADAGLAGVVLQNLFSNAWKYTMHRDAAVIEFGGEMYEGGPAFFVRDNGVGFEMKNADRLFAPFQRMHRQEEFPGSGVGLATVQRIIHRHGGHIWAQARPDRGATFYFTLPQ